MFGTWVATVGPRVKDSFEKFTLIKSNNTKKDELMKKTLSIILLLIVFCPIRPLNFVT